MEKKLFIACCFLFFLQSLIAQKSVIPNLEKLVEQSEVFSKIFTGFALYDPSSDQFMYQHEADKYYTPASNTKLFTLYTSLEVLGDSIPTLIYQETDTSLIFWGTGNPAFLNPLLPKDSVVVNFLRSSKQPLYFSSHNFQDARFGPGWSWDDYNYTYQTEKSPFPIYGNNVYFKHESGQLGLLTTPKLFTNNVQLNTTLPNSRPLITRDMDSNTFECNTAALLGKSYEIRRPFRYTDALFAQILSDTLNRTVNLQTKPIPIAEMRYLYSGIPADSIYQLMMQESDNFIAEQLLNTCANQLFGIQDPQLILNYAKDSLLHDLPDAPRWVDGSGLSRYNLFTPRSVAMLLKKIYTKLPKDRWSNIFAAGGVSGTIEKWYEAPTGEAPYVYAKTGTLSNKHCLSGYLISKSGKVLIFSFMHNNYLGSSAPVKEEMQVVLEYIRDAF